MGLQYDMARFKTKGDDDDEDEDKSKENECEDCIRIPKKFSFNEVRKYWILLLSLQTELGELWYDMQGFNAEADLEIKFCNQKKSDLQVLINSIAHVKKLNEFTMNEWSKCLKQRKHQDADQVKQDIHKMVKDIFTLINQIAEMEKTVTVDECEDWLSSADGSIAQKYYGDCEANKDIIEKLWVKLAAKVKKSEEKYAAEGTLFKSATAEKERLTALNPEEGCATALNLSIAKDKWTGDKKRHECIAMDEDNTDVNECYYEKVQLPEGVELAEGEEAKALVWLDGKMFYCDEPVEPTVEDQDEEDSLKKIDYALPVINMINP